MAVARFPAPRPATRPASPARPDSGLLIAVLSAALGGIVVPAPAAADSTFVVDSVLDQIDADLVDIGCATAAGTCTLRAAVMQANENPGNTVIVLPAGTYTMTRLPSGANGADSGDYNLDRAAPWTIVIEGAGAGSTIVDGNDLDRVFRIEDDTAAWISGLTVRNGSAHGGGCILVQGRLDLSGSRVIDCVSSLSGGGITVDTDEPVTIEYTDLVGNFALSFGGGIYYSSAAFVSDFRYGAIRDNDAMYGGGVAVGGAMLLAIQASEIHGNSARGGGGLYLSNPSAQVEIEASSVFGNFATYPNVGNGGGIENLSILHLTNSTVSGNEAARDGGGIANYGETWIYNATIAFNMADSDADAGGGEGGGIYNAGGAAFGLRNSVVAGNYRSGAPVPSDCVGAVQAFGHNRFGDFAGCAVTHAGSCGGADEVLAAPSTELGPLAFHGGPTPTHEVGAGSSLIDDVDPPCVCQDRDGVPLGTDQRGAARVVGARCDVGAFEFGALPAGALFSDGFENGTSWSWD